MPTWTAYRWAKDPEVRRLVEDCRRRCLDAALGWMARHSMRAAKRITQLGESAESESVQLRASRAILSDQMAVSKFSTMEYRMTAIEEKLRARIGNANCQR